MDYLPLETKLIAKNNCKMNDGSGNALIVGKEYKVIFHSKNTEEIAIESELYPHHFFSIYDDSDSSWKRYFNVEKNGNN
jgi:hypothetical protein